MNQYTVFDIETPNRMNDSICQIGVINEWEGERVHFDYLVNPECGFDYLNTRIHGISYDDVRSEPNFIPIWQELRKHFQNNVIVGHNVTFDLAVLNKTLLRYGQPLIEVDFIDTMALMKSLGLRSSLDFSCDYFGIELIDHHNALADARATLELFDILKHEIPTYKNHIRKYAFDPVTRRMRRQPAKPDPILLPPTDRTVIQEVLTVHGLSFCNETPPDLSGCNICLSGNFRKGQKETVKNALIERGAEVFDRLTLKIDYLLVGSIPDPQWSNGSYGTKVKKAMEMMKKGHPIRILAEEEVF